MKRLSDLSPSPPLPRPEVSVAQARDATCYVFVKEGASSEGNSLYPRKDGLAMRRP